MLKEDSQGVVCSRKMYSCIYCGKEFKSKWNKITHEGIHKEAKPFSCELCGKAFSLKGNLKAHMIKHYKDMDEMFQAQFQDYS